MRALNATVASEQAVTMKHTEILVGEQDMERLYLIKSDI